MHFPDNCEHEIIDEIERIIVNNHLPLKEFALLRPKLFLIRDALRKCVSTQSVYFDAAADLLHLYANTKTFFVHNNYDLAKSAPFSLSELGFNLQNESKFAHFANMKCPKPYGPLYVWGQATFWFKQ